MKRIYLKRRKPFRGGETVYDRNILSIFKKVYDCSSYLIDKMGARYEKNRN